MTLQAWIKVACAGLVLAACGSTVVTGTTGSGTGAGSSTGNGAGTGTGAWPGTGGGSSSGDCATSADCPGGGACVPLTPGGYKVCLHAPAEATTCHMPPMMPADQCCTSADCKDGKKCYPTEDLPQCSGPFMPPYNECLADQCTSDVQCAASDLPPQICAPAGAYGQPVRACFTAYCHTDADCTAKPGGVCVPVSQPCCQTPAGLACVYPGGCRKDADCGAGESCAIHSKSGTGECGQPQGCAL